MTTKYMTPQMVSAAISDAPGITPVRLADQLDYPMAGTMPALRMFLRNRAIVWDGGVNDPVFPIADNSEAQLQALRNAGIEVERPL